MTSLTDRYTIVYTNTAQQSIEDQIEHLAIYQGNDLALKRMNCSIDVFEPKLKCNPLAYKISPQASELGVLHYHELNTEKLRILYEVLEDDLIVVVHLVLGEKQSVEKALIRNCLLLPLRPK